jgi:hypothetical protein
MSDLMIWLLPTGVLNVNRKPLVVKRFIEAVPNTVDGNIKEPHIEF